MAGVDVAEWKRALGRACAAKNDEEVEALLSSAAVDQKTREVGVQLAIERATGRKTGKQSIALLLLNKFDAASLLTDDAFKDILLRAIDIDDAEIVRSLLRAGSRGNLDVKDRKTLYRTPLAYAAQQGHVKTLQVLLEAGAGINSSARNGQTVLIYLAAESGPEKQQLLSVVDWLVKHHASPSLKDAEQKSAVHWAAITGKVEMIKVLMHAVPKPDLEATSDRGRTALHFAAAGDCTDDAVTDLLLNAGADPTKRSDGGWTPLHNAAKHGNLKVVQRLLKAGASINATLSNRVTPLHWAAGEGHEDIVRFFLADERVQKHRKDGFGSTPMIRAAQNDHRTIAKLFHPCHDASALSNEQRSVCESDTFRATVVDFDKNPGHGPPESLVKKVKMWNLLYNDKFTLSANPYPSESKQRSRPKAKRAAHRDFDRGKKFRWIHMPANNMSWVETLFTKLFIEEEAADVDSFKALQKTLSHQHRGRHVHSTFMIPNCSHIPRAPSDTSWLSKHGPISEPPESIPAVTPNTPPKTKDGKAAKSKVQVERDVSRAKTRKKQLRRQSTTSIGNTAKQDSTSEQPDDDSEEDSIDDLGEAEPATRHGNIALFMPYLHFESHERRLHMTKTIRSVKSCSSSEASSETEKLYADDVMLVRAYLDSAPSLHPRRTLDQFLYHSFDTEMRDNDQVVFRYFRDALKRAPKIYMVDQLWLWIWGEDLLVTSFPQRWGQSELRNDPLCVLEGVIEDINSKTRPPVKSVHDLAMLITGRCSGGFDRHRLGDQEFQFLDMFDSSIGDLSVQEPILFEKFERASSLATTWLREQENRGETQKGASLSFVNDLLDIKQETTLLKELKDIRDELNIIKSIFAHQRKVLKVFEEAICEERHEDKTEAERRFREQRKLTQLHSEDVDRMDSQAQAIFTSLTQLLDFKQKHANAIEARFAREQAEFTAGQARLTARQGETIMVFTIVTIFFLPVSFVAAFFTIDVVDYPRLSLSYVSKYVFGIGLSISFVLITVAFLLDDIREIWRRRRRRYFQLLSRDPRVSEKGMKTVDTPAAVKQLHNHHSEVFGPPPRVDSRLSALTGRSAISRAYSRLGRDPEWGR